MEYKGIYERTCGTSPICTQGHHRHWEFRLMSGLSFEELCGIPLVSPADSSNPSQTRVSAHDCGNNWQDFSRLLYSTRKLESDK